MCERCDKFFERYRCNKPLECDCPKCQNTCLGETRKVVVLNDGETYSDAHGCIVGEIAVDGLIADDIEERVKQEDFLWSSAIPCKVLCEVGTNFTDETVLTILQAAVNGFDGDDDLGPVEERVRIKRILRRILQKHA